MAGAVTSARVPMWTASRRFGITQRERTTLVALNVNKNSLTLFKKETTYNRPSSIRYVVGNKMDHFITFVTRLYGNAERRSMILQTCPVHSTTSLLVTSWRHAGHARLPRNKSGTNWQLPRNICYEEVARNWSQWNLVFTPLDRLSQT